MIDDDYAPGETRDVLAAIRDARVDLALGRQLKNADQLLALAEAHIRKLNGELNESYSLIDAKADELANAAENLRELKAALA